MSWTVQKSNTNMFDPPHPGGFRGVAGGLGVNISKVREISWTAEKIVIFFTHPPPRGVAVGILGGKKIKSPGNVMNCPEMQYKFVWHTPPQEIRGVAGGGGVLKRIYCIKNFSKKEHSLFNLGISPIQTN